MWPPSVRHLNETDNALIQAGCSSGTAQFVATRVAHELRPSDDLVPNQLVRFDPDRLTGSTDSGSNAILFSAGVTWYGIRIRRQAARPTRQEQRGGEPAGEAARAGRHHDLCHQLLPRRTSVERTDHAGRRHAVPSRRFLALPVAPPRRKASTAHVTAAIYRGLPLPTIQLAPAGINSWWPSTGSTLQPFRSRAR